MAYARSLPLRASADAYNLSSLIDDLINNAKAHLANNAIFVPVLQTFKVLLEADVLEELSRDPEGIKK